MVDWWFKDTDTGVLIDSGPLTFIFHLSVLSTFFEIDSTIYIVEILPTLDT